MPNLKALQVPATTLSRILARYFSDALLGFLAILSAALTLMPMGFDLSPRADAWVETGQWVIVGIFCIEYGLGLAAAERAKAFLLNGWRILDLITIVVPFFTLIPGVADALRSSPALRLIRLIRVFALGARASGVILREEAGRAGKTVLKPVEVTDWSQGRFANPHPASWDDFLRWVQAREPGWYNADNVGPAEARQVAAATGLDMAYIESHLQGSSYPHYERQGDCGVLFLWLPAAGPAPAAERQGLLLLATKTSLLTLSRRSRELPLWTASSPAKELEQLPLPSRVTCVLLQTVLHRQEELVGHCERELSGLEEIPVHESRPAFFERAFRLKKEVSAAQSDLWRLRGLLSDFAQGRAQLPSGSAAETEFFRRLADQAEYLYETATNFREGLLSIIDLHLNVNSFEMNRVMRVLAVASVIGLIPGVVGGLFGMNLAGNPWPMTLPQVASAVGFSMIVCLYFFFVKGWLR